MNGSRVLFQLLFILLTTLSGYARDSKPTPVRDTTRNGSEGYPVIGLRQDTLFRIYSRIGSFTPRERAVSISGRIRQLYDQVKINPDSILTVESENAVDIVYHDMIVMTVTESDASAQHVSKMVLARKYVVAIKSTLRSAKAEKRPWLLMMRIGLTILVLGGIWLLIYLLNIGYARIERLVANNKDRWLHNLKYRDYTYLTVEQELRTIWLLLKLFKWFSIILLLYLFLPLVFSIFPFTKGWATVLFNLIWSPFRGVLVSIWTYIPNLFRILVIYFVFRYGIRGIRYVFSEIEAGKLKLSGFHDDWAMPTFLIVRFLLYAFMFVLIFPYLPGSDSNIFKGVSVFLGVLLSLGSTSAISNIIAGLVITYMRPFKVGDRIKIGEISGDVVEKTLLITRLRTIKNEEITIPNSTILSSNTLNYSVLAESEGLIIHTAVTIGYDVPWKDMHQALIDAARRTKKILSDPDPFVMQTSLDDFYVTYQINAYTREANNQAAIYSELHQNIQDVCYERGIEIMSPHYRSERNGNPPAMPAAYLQNKKPVTGFNPNAERQKE